MAILERSLGPQHSEMGDVVYDFAAFQHSQGNREEAKSWYQRALTIYEQALGQYHPSTMEARKSYATLLREMGRQDEAALLEALQPEQVKTDGE